MITFRCPSCKNTMTSDDGEAGQKIPCPTCGQRLQVPAAQGAEGGPLPPPIPAAQGELPAAQGAYAPRSEGALALGFQKLKAWSALLWARLRVMPRQKLLIGAGACVLLLLFLVWVGNLLFSSPGFEADMKYMPNDCNCVISARVDEILESDAYKLFKRDFPEFEKKFEGNMGFSLENVTRYSVFFTLENQDIAVIRLNKKITASDIKSARKSGFFKKYNEVKVGAYTIQETYEQVPKLTVKGEIDEKITVKGRSFCVIDGKLILDGYSEQLAKILERDKRPEIVQGLQDVLKKADFSQTLAVVINLKAGISAEKINEAFSEAGLKGQRDKVDGFTGFLSLGRECRVNLNLLCKDGKSAEDIRKILDASLVVGVGNLKEDKNTPAEVKAALDAVKLTSSGNTISANVAFKTEPVVKSILSIKAIADQIGK